MDIQDSNIANRSDSGLDNLDLDKLKAVFRKSLPIVLFVILISLSISTIAIRYTKQLFQSSSVLQLDIKSEAKVLGFKSFDEDINNLAREIEIIKSKLFLTKVAESLSFDISYFQYGDVLFEERYKNSPFLIDIITKKNNILNRAIDLEILNSSTFNLTYQIADKIVDQNFNFNDTVKTNDIEFRATLTDEYEPEIDNRYFFVLNTSGLLVSYINKNLTVEPLDFKAKTITVSFSDHNRQKAHDIVYAIDTLYIYYTQLEKNKANNQKIKFLNEQLSQTEDKLTELENYFENFTIENKTTDLSANLSKTILLLEELDSQRFSIQQKIEAYDVIYNQIRKSNNALELNLADAFVLPTEIRKEIDKLNSLYQENKILLSSYKENTLAYRKKNQEIEYVKEQITDFIVSSRNKLSENLKDINVKRKRLESEFVELPSKRTEYSKTERYYGLYEEFYLSLMQNKAEFELAQAGTVTDYKILSSASMPSEPISPNKVIYYGIGILAGLLFSFLFIGIRYLMHNKITSQTELEKMSSAFVLGTIPYYGKEKSIKTRLVVNNNLKSEISEAFRTIRTNLEFLNGDKKPIIAITSTVSGEGKTFIAANLGGIISLLDNKVILIDLDMRKPRFHEVFEGTDQSKGLSTILISKHEIKECIHETSLGNLDYIPAGPIPPNPSELILGAKFDKLIDFLQERYDLIIIDTPPVGLVTDGIQALKKATIPIYIVRADFSKKIYVKNINRIVKVHKLKNVSLILNSLKKSSNGKYGYRKGYYEDAPGQKKKKLIRIFQS